MASEKLFEKRVEGTDEQLDALEEFMTTNGLEWKIIE